MKTFKETVTHDESLCVGCSCCELACSFHREEAFGPEGSAIKIRRSLNAPPAVNFELDCKCDMCEGLEIPACIDACWQGALRISRLI